MENLMNNLCRNFTKVKFLSRLSCKFAIVHELSSTLELFLMQFFLGLLFSNRELEKLESENQKIKFAHILTQHEMCYLIFQTVCVMQFSSYQTLRDKIVCDALFKMMGPAENIVTIFLMT